jgi:hypothetical protein
LDGVSESVRKSFGMRDAISKTKINPKEKMKKINDMVKMLLE